MQKQELVCILDGDDYKEYEVLIDAQPLGVISWNGEREASEGSWYTTASDGHPRYFQTQREVVDFLKENPLKSASELSAKIKAEASKLMDIAAEIEADGTPPEA
jgi:hypothetical protein